MIDQNDLKALVLLLLALGTIFFFGSVERYEVLNGDIIKNSLFIKAGKSWLYSDEGVFFNTDIPKAIKLVARNSEGYTHVSQRVPKTGDFKLLRLSADVKTEKVVRGDKDWKSARVVLVMYDKNGRAMYHFPHTLIEKHGDSDWRRYKKVFRINNDAEEVMVAAQLMNASGEMWIRNIQLEAVKEKEDFAAYKLCNILFLGFIILWIVIPLIKNVAYSPSGVLAFIFVFGIIVAVLLPETIMHRMDKNFSYNVTMGNQLEKYFELINHARKTVNTTEGINFSLYKTGHFFMFFILTIILYLKNNHRLKTIKLFYYMSLFAFVTEVLQLFSEGRDAQLQDFIIDISGVVVALAAGSVYVAATARLSRGH